MSSAKKMIGNLPKTGDGFPIGVGGRVWFVGGLPEDKPADWAEVQSVSKDEIRLRPVQRVTWLHPSCCYSTKQNAIAMTTRPKSLRRKRT